jgi:hypothetical protein
VLEGAAINGLSCGRWRVRAHRRGRVELVSGLGFESHHLASGHGGRRLARFLCETCYTAFGRRWYSPFVCDPQQFPLEIHKRIEEARYDVAVLRVHRGLQVCVRVEGGRDKGSTPTVACEAGRAARRGWAAEPDHFLLTFYLSPPPSTHTHISSVPPSLGFCLDAYAAIVVGGFTSSPSGHACLSVLNKAFFKSSTLYTTRIHYSRITLIVLYTYYTRLYTYYTRIEHVSYTNYNREL